MYHVLIAENVSLLSRVIRNGDPSIQVLAGEGPVVTY